MSRALLILNGPADKAKASHWIAKAPYGTRVEFKRAKRTTDQNAKMWAMLTEVAEQVLWHGIRLHADDWKLLFLDAMKREVRMVPNIDGNGFVSLGRSSSDLSKDEMGDLIEIIYAFGANRGVVFSEPGERQQHGTEAAA